MVLGITGSGLNLTEHTLEINSQLQFILYTSAKLNSLNAKDSDWVKLCEVIDGFYLKNQGFHPVINELREFIPKYRRKDRLSDLLK